MFISVSFLSKFSHQNTLLETLVFKSVNTILCDGAFVGVKCPFWFKNIEIFGQYIVRYGTCINANKHRTRRFMYLIIELSKRK